MAPPNTELPTRDKRILTRHVRERGPRFEEEVRAVLEAELPDLSDRVLQRSEEEVEAFTRELSSEKSLREQRIARQLEGAPAAPQAELLPGDTRD